ncbi:hypothetical protein CIK05_01815 [Bdellovibrio sp. qaytius]|nr:hypothetical protein CIK05_01815 [Bdellovibrio sp. qaytius]
MDIDRVYYFHVFADTGSLVKACEILRISQPALSKALRLLEQEVGFTLIESEGRGLRLSEYGHMFKAETAPLLTAWSQVPEKLRLGKASVPSRIGSFEVFTTYFLSILTKFTALESLELHEFGPGHLEKAVSDGHVDVGITYVPIPKAGIEFVEATKIKMGAFGLKKFKTTALKDLPFVVPLVPPDGTPSKVIGLDGWPEHKFNRNIRYRVTMMESAMELCREGHAVAYLPEFIVKLHNEKVLPEYRLTELTIPVSQKERLQSVFLITKSHAQESTLHREIAKGLRSLS